MFKKAERKQAKLKIALSGPAGGGKTYSALLVAAGLVGEGGKIALIDTENKSASLYAGLPGIPEFDVLEIAPPFEHKKYHDAIHAAVRAKYDCLVIDSISHLWSGDGGLLDQKEALDRTGKGNSYTNWASITKKHEQFKSDILQSDIHMICTMRSKQDYAIVENEKGKSSVQKLGMAPIQRDGMEYEFTLVLDLAMSHDASVSKDRTNLFDGKIFRPTVETGVELRKWMLSGIFVPPPVWKADESAYKAMVELSQKRGWKNALSIYLKTRFGLKRFSEFTETEYTDIMNCIRTLTPDAAVDLLLGQNKTNKPAANGAAPPAEKEPEGPAAWERDMEKMETEARAAQ